MSLNRYSPLRKSPVVPPMILCSCMALLVTIARAQTPAATSPAPVVRTVFPNGLVLLSKEDHAAPVVSVWTYYRVGSVDEVQGIFGISHQLEHMMFKGTHYLQPGDIDKLFSERGGENNAETTQDYTAYNETLPSSALSVALKVEADRMEHSLMDPAQLAHEKTVVLSELEGDENSPLYRLDTAVTEAAFVAHPYGNPVGGYLSDVRHFTRAQVEHYYATHYAPNNAVLVVVGDFNTAALKKTVARFFAVDHSRAVGEHRITVEPAQQGERRITVSGVGDSAYVELAYHVPQTGDRDHYVMDVISTVLAGGRSSRLYRALVEKGLASEVDAGDPDLKDPYLMEVTATVARGHTQQEVEKAIEAEIDRLQSEPVGDRELQQTVNQVKADFVYRDDSVTSQASELGARAVTISYRYDDTYLQRISSVTAAEVQAAAQRYLVPENRTVGWFVPRAPRPGELVQSGRGGGIHYKPWHDPSTELPGERLPLSSANPAPLKKPEQGVWAPHYKWALPAGAESAKAAILPGRDELARLIQRRSHRTRPRAHPVVVEDESAAPGLVPPARTGHPPVTRQVLPNGLVVLVYPDHSNPDVSISGAIRAGALADPADKHGLANFVADMLDRGAGNRTEDQIASALDFVGASADVSASGSGTFFNGHALVENWPLVLEILSDEIRNPTFPSNVVDRMRNQLETEIQVDDDNPEVVAIENFFATLYPADYPLHWPVIGVADSVREITRDDLIAFHDKYYRPDLTTIVVVGDVQPDAAVQMIQQYFGSWTANGPTPTTEPPVMQDQIPAQQVNKTMPGKSEEITVMGFRGITRKDPDYYPAYLMNLILGNGDFNSRFMKDIRDRKGLVYGVSSGFEAGLVAGPWILEMQSGPTNAGRAIGSATLDMRQMQLQGPSPAEMRLFKGWVSGNQALRLETSAGIAESLLQAEYYGLGLDYTWTYPELINAVNRQEALEAAKRFLHPDNLVISTAGPS